MIYSEKEIELLRFSMLGSEDPNDEYPPFSAVSILWKGEIVPFVNGITIDAHSITIKSISIHVATRQNRGYMKDDENFSRIMREMRERSINIIGWPEELDKT